MTVRLISAATLFQFSHKANFNFVSLAKISAPDGVVYHPNIGDSPISRIDEYKPKTNPLEVRLWLGSGLGLYS